MATKKKAAADKVMLGKSSTENYDLDLMGIVSNEEQSRGNGVTVNLESEGIGVLKRIDANKPSLWEMLLGDDLEKRKEAVELCKEKEADLYKLAEDLITFGQLQPIGFRPVFDGDGKEVPNQYNVIFGMRRAIGRALVYAMSGGKFPRNVRAILVNWHETPADLFLLSLAENTSRKNESAVDQAKYYKQLTKMGMGMKKIAEVTGDTYQNVRNRLQILQLPQATQDKIHEGKASWTREVKKLTGDKGGAGGRNAGSNADGRKRMPTVKQVEEHYGLLEKPETMSKEEWEILSDEGARKYMAHYAGYTYMTRKDLKKKKQDDEKAALLAAQAAAAGEKADAAAK